MGKYINTNSRGEQLSHTSKHRDLIADGAKLLPNPPKYQENLVCVVDNGFFQAAAYCYSESEFEAFNDPHDSRPKMWFFYSHAKELAR